MTRARGQEQITLLRARSAKCAPSGRKLSTPRYSEPLNRELFQAEQKRIMDGIAEAERDIAYLQLTDGDYDLLFAKAVEMLRAFPMPTAPFPSTSDAR